MSIASLSWAKKQVTGSPTLKAVLSAVADYADERGIAWPSQEQLAKDTEMSTRTILRALATLEENGFLARKRRNRSDGTRASDIIYLNLKRQNQSDNQPHDTVSGDNLSCDNDGLTKVTHSPNLPDRESPLIRDTTYPSCEPPIELPYEQPIENSLRSPKSPEKKKIKINKKPDYHGDFNMLWAEYHEGSKLKAYEAWLKLSVEDRDPCFDGMRLYKADLGNVEKYKAMKRDPPIPQHLSTFINKRHFDDWLEREAS